MRKLILEEWMSLDGNVTDKNGRLEFFTDLSPEQNKYSDLDQLKFLESVDTMLLGRKTYELFTAFWPTATIEKELIADKLNSMEKIVFTNTLTSAPWGGFKDAEIMNGEAIDSVKKLKTMPGRDMVLWGSISIAGALMKENLIDEYHIQLCPILTGGGRTLFTGDDLKKLSLEACRKYDTGTVRLSYIPALQEK